MARKNARLFVFFLGLMITISARSSDAITEGELLIQFKETLSNVSALTSWNISKNNPCTDNTQNWFGVRCGNGAVVTLLFENMGSEGGINIDLLVGLPMLRSLSFKFNRLDGPLPDVKKLSGLRMLYLSSNNFSGEIVDDAFSGMSSLKKLYLDRNEFVGEIPKSLVDLPRLTELSVADNGFEGKIPFKENNQLVVMDFANNRFEGRIPSSFSKLSPAIFAGNIDLCGAPLSTPCKESKKLSVLSIHLVAAAGLTLLVLLFTLIILLVRRRNAKKAKLNQKPVSKLTKKTSSKLGSSNGGGARKEVLPPDAVQALEYKKLGELGRLSFVRDGVEIFEFQDLLRASAEVLGSGSFGSSYKAVLSSGSAMVVKRFRHMSNVGKEEFCEHMRRLGRLTHPNLSSLVAFYYKKEEKLLVSEFVENGCLASHLHGKRAIGQPGLDWPTRLKVIKGVARGLAYLYKELPGLTVPHGHLKSSNVLLDSTFEPILMDYALVPVVDQGHAHQFMVAYKSPEFTQNDQTTKKTDVWSFGILILEILTGKFPANFLKQGKGNNTDLAAWVSSVVREEWTGEVFDKDMKKTKNGEGEMLKLLKIGMDCCEWDLDKRWDFEEAVEKIEGLKERDSEEDNSSYASEGVIYSRAISHDDDFSFSAAK